MDGTPIEAGSFTFVATPSSAPRVKTSSAGREHVFSAQHIAAAPQERAKKQAGKPPPPEATLDRNGTSLDPRLHYDQHQASQNEARPSLCGGLPPPSPYDAFSQQSAASIEHSPPCNAPATNVFTWSPQHSAKRVKLSPSRSTPNLQPSPLFAVPQHPAQFDQSPSSTYFTPHSISSIVNTPATPSSSIGPGSPYQPQPASLVVQDSPDLRRLSVKSLLQDSLEEPPKPRFTRSESTGNRTYGYDHGLQDLDIPRNDDHHVLLPQTPDMRQASAAVSEASSSNGEVDVKHIAFEPGGYYAEPVPIKIPRFLEPLPEELLHNQMNLIYFHHFINHTGRIMVPHDCPENPFRSILPQMAVRNAHLLHLVLAFSASPPSPLTGSSGAFHQDSGMDE